MSEQIYLGRWTDWSNGPVVGDSLTMSTRHATYLISFIATFDVWVASAAWDLIAFMLHQALTIRAPKNAAAHQIQVILRNCSTPVAFVRNAVFIGWAWRKRSKQITIRIFILALLPIILAILFVAAGVGSSRIASTGDVLLLGNDCGLVNPNVTNAADEIQIQLGQGYQNGMRLSLSNGYAQECYTNPFDTETAQLDDSDVSRINCQGYTRGALNYTTSTVDCPLGKTCAAPALQLDTGYLDSHYDFGLNQPQKNRVLYRKVTTCAPLVTKGFSNNEFSNVGSQENVAVYSYGNNSYQPTRFGATGLIPSADATFVYSKNTYTSSQTAYYMMIASTMQVGTQGALYAPVPALSTEAANPISLVFLANRAFYQGEVIDPWFNATSVIESTANGNVADELFQSENPGSVLGCTEQIQFCNPNAKTGNSCTDLNSWYQWGDFTTYYGGTNITALSDIGMNDMQQTTAMMLQDASISATVWNVIDQLGPVALVASNFVEEQEFFWSPPLPNNQWQAEVANWFSIGLAHTQRLFIATYRKPNQKIQLDYWLPFPASATSETTWCNSQKVHSAEYTTFSVLGLGLNFGIGIVVLFAGYLLPFVVPRLQARRARRRGKISVAQEQWFMNGSLQLQRIAYEAHGVGDWEGRESTVPITAGLTEFIPLSQRSVASSLRRFGSGRTGEKSGTGSIADTMGGNDSPLLMKAHGPGTHEEEGEGEGEDD